MPTIKRSTSGFSLVELSVVVLIIGILIYMTLAAGRQQLEIARIKQTQYKLQKIQTALAVYYKTYGHLPCPADGLVSKTDPNFGMQGGYTGSTFVGYSNPSSTNGDASCAANDLLTDQIVPNLYVGVVPVADLGMSADSIVDAWGNRFTYIVSADCVDPDDWNVTNTYKCGYVAPGSSTLYSTQDGGRIWLKDKYGNPLLPTSTYAAYIIISHGMHGYGAWPSNGGAKITVNGAGAVSVGEYHNGNLSTTTGGAISGANAYTYYYDTSISDGDIANNYFDNLTAWATAPQIYYSANH